jgi:endonuclease/exonuclease/phosphatase (EEP) superfamily protein YafD
MRGVLVARFIVVACVLYGIAIVFWQILRYIVGDRWMLVAAADIASVYLFLPLVVLLPLAFLSRRGLAVVGVLVPLFIFLVLYGGMFLPHLPPNPGEGDVPFRVLALNIRSDRADGAGIEELVSAHSPDLIALQELTPRIREDLVSRLGAEYPYHVYLRVEDVTGLGLFSRRPLDNVHEIPEPDWGRHSVAATVVVDGQDVFVINVHNWPSWAPPSSLYPVPMGFEGSFRVREEQARLWIERVKEFGGPALVIGDFNFTDQTTAYGLLADGLQDAHRQVGRGLGHTFPSDSKGVKGFVLPRRILRLDYVWYSDHWEAMDFQVGRWDGQSDHYPVIADFRLSSE